MGTPLPRPTRRIAAQSRNLTCRICVAWFGGTGFAVGFRWGVHWPERRQAYASVRARAEIHSGMEAERDKTFDQTRVHNVEEMVPGCTARNRNSSSRARLVPY